MKYKTLKEFLQKKDIEIIEVRRQDDSKRIIVHPMTVAAEVYCTNNFFKTGRITYSIIQF